MANKWTATIKSDVEGDEPQKLVLKGTNDPRIAQRAAERIAAAQANRVARKWGAEATPTMTVEPVKADGDDNSPPGAFKPAGAKPIDLNRFVAGDTAPKRIKKNTTEDAK